MHGASGPPYALMPEEGRASTGKGTPLFVSSGKFSLQYERVLGNSSSGQIKLDPALSKLATGKLELEVKEPVKGKQEKDIEKKPVEPPAKQPEAKDGKPMEDGLPAFGADPAPKLSVDISASKDVKFTTVAALLSAVQKNQGVPAQVSLRVGQAEGISAQMCVSPEFPYRDLAGLLDIFKQASGL